MIIISVLHVTKNFNPTPKAPEILHSVFTKRIIAIDIEAVRSTLTLMTCSPASIYVPCKPVFTCAFKDIHVISHA